MRTIGNRDLAEVTGGISERCADDIAQDTYMGLAAGALVGAVRKRPFAGLIIGGVLTGFGSRVLRRSCRRRK